MSALPPIVGKGSAAWHTLVIAGQACPGVCVVKPKRGYKVDKKSGLGEDGGTTTLQGKDVPSTTVTVRVWKQDQLEKLAALVATLFPFGGPAPDPFTVSHPVLAIQGITSLFFESVDGPTQVEPGLWELQLQATEFRAPKPAPAVTPKKSTGAAQGNKLFEKKGKKLPAPAKPAVKAPGAYGSGPRYG